MGKRTLALNTQKAGWAPEPVWTVWRRENLLPSAGNRNTIPRLTSWYPSHNTDRPTPALLWSVKMYSYCAATGLMGHKISARLMYSYCPSIWLNGHNISTDSRILPVPLLDWRVKISPLHSCIPTAPLLDWRGKISLQTREFLLSRYWTEGAQYLYRLKNSYCPSIGLDAHNISTDSRIPTVPLLD
jgi:hypothetical protein